MAAWIKAMLLKLLFSALERFFLCSSCIEDVYFSFSDLYIKIFSTFIDQVFVMC